ncbi:MAG: helix-turn-helix domain-containing protein [Ruminococcus sp.]|nr:helix-turn-helix domain-containing protein [Ruminococcus sp.]
MKNKVNIPIYDRLWYAIRKWQRATGTTASELARILGISERTLRDYDKSARTMTLEKLTNFINYTNGSIEIKF